MADTPVTNRPPSGLPTFPWWIILCLVGLDYFSSLAYLPSLAINAVGSRAPLAGLAVAGITLLAALPVYLYVVGRSPHGEGGVGLLDRNLHGWGGKILILFVLGFVATDFVITRTLSMSDAATHILANPFWKSSVEQVVSNKDQVREALPPALQGQFFEFWNEQLLLTLILSILAFGLYFFMVNRLTHGFLSIAVGVVGLYLILTAIILVSSLLYLGQNPGLVSGWYDRFQTENATSFAGNKIADLVWLALWVFPPVAIGLSGFELSMASAPLVQGNPSDDPNHPHGRIARTRLLMVVAAVLMSVLVVCSVSAVALLVPREGGEMEHRALAHLAHGSPLVDGQLASEINPIFGAWFGSLYDLSAVLILCLAGASATISLRDMVPKFLSRFGMQMAWAHRTGVIIHLFNLVILVVTVAFHASVTLQQGAYATAVIALLLTASLAAFLDVRHRCFGLRIRWPLSGPFCLSTLLFALMGVLLVVRSPWGLAISLAFVAVIFITALTSRWVRATEFRFEGFAFPDDASKSQWEQICKLDFQVLVPHHLGHLHLADKEAEIRLRHRIPHEVPVIFVEVELGDPSDFTQSPLLQVRRDDDRTVIHVSRCTSVAHVLAAIGLAFREVGQPPEIHFGWSNESSHSANLGFLLFGQGNVPWLVHELINKVERDAKRQPRVVIG